MIPDDAAVWFPAFVELSERDGRSGWSTSAGCPFVVGDLISVGS
jgi:hypothetical protein